jgi:bifunctional UDP-N-acetylglucosamine pyrophosphorylase / glucosamine-1-phosphate N-acetyltransferase
MKVSAIVLAAGEGSRMRSARPKPLHQICGRPMVMHVIYALAAIDVDRTVVVVGHGAERVTKKVQEQVGPTSPLSSRRCSAAPVMPPWSA